MVCFGQNTGTENRVHGHNSTCFPYLSTWWRHQMETFFALRAVCAGIHRSQVNSPHRRQWRGALTFSLIYNLNKRMSKQSWGWWFETPSHSLCNDIKISVIVTYLIWRVWTQEPNRAMQVSLYTPRFSACKKISKFCPLQKFEKFYTNCVL